MRNGFAVQYSIQRIPQVELRGLGTLLAEIHQAVVDPAAVKNPAVRGQYRGLGSRGSAGERRERFLWIEEIRERIAELLGVTPDIGGGGGRIALNPIEGEAARTVIMRD